MRKTPTLHRTVSPETLCSKTAAKWLKNGTQSTSLPKEDKNSPQDIYKK